MKLNLGKIVFKYNEIKASRIFMKVILSVFLIFAISCASNTKSKEELTKEKAEIYYNQGTQNLVNIDYTKALKNLLEAFRLSDEDSRIQNNLGMAYFFKKRPETALKFLKMAIKTDPKNTDARMNMATLYMERGNFNEARVQYNKVLDDLTYEKQYQTYYNLGVMAAKQEKPTQALNYFKQSINELENYCPAHFEIGKLYFKQREFKKSLMAYKKSGTGVCYNNPRPLYHQALTLIELKQYNNAKIKLEEVIERFSPTEYQRLASKKLQALNKKIKMIEENPMFLRNNKGNILTPDF